MTECRLAGPQCALTPEVEAVLGLDAVVVLESRPGLSTPGFWTIVPDPGGTWLQALAHTAAGLPDGDPWAGCDIRPIETPRPYCGLDCGVWSGHHCMSGRGTAYQPRTP